MVNPYVSIAIPCYDIKGKGAEVLDYSLNIISVQTYKNYDVVITDHSEDNEVGVESVFNKWKDKIDIKYYRNVSKRGSPSANTNMSLAMSTGHIIKLLCQDDYLFGVDALEKIVRDFIIADKYWLVSPYYHTRDRSNLNNLHNPTNNSNIKLINTIGSPTCLTIKNKDVMFLDEELIYFYDCEYYQRLFNKYGDPYIMKDPTAVVYLWDGQTTNTLVHNELRCKEEQYISRKYSS